MALVPYITLLQQIQQNHTEPIPPLLNPVLNIPELTTSNITVGSRLIDSFWGGEVKQSKKKIEKRKRTTFVNKQRQIFDLIGHDCIELVINYLDLVSRVNLSYVSKYLYNFRKLDYSDLTHYIHQNKCLKKPINASQLLELLGRNDCSTSLKFIWNICVNLYRSDAKGYAKVLEKIACEYDPQNSETIYCKLCHPTLFHGSYSFGISGMYIGGQFYQPVDRPPVVNSIGLSEHSIPLDDGELAMGSRSNPLTIITKVDQGKEKRYVKLRINGRSALMPFEFN